MFAAVIVLDPALSNSLDGIGLIDDKSSVNLIFSLF
jgi:hypothetical protein